jgi:hypothetical protein
VLLLLLLLRRLPGSIRAPSSTKSSATTKRFPRAEAAQSRRELPN